jgi:hypothetical protein
MATKADLAELRSEMATKADLAGIARNVDITALQRIVEQNRTEMQAMRADVRLLTGMVPSILGAVQALAEHQIRLSDRITALETPPQT